jgi:hypothetical protein
MKLSKRTLAAVAVTGVTSGAIAFGGATLAAASSAQSPAAATVATTTPAATPTPAPAPSSGGCVGGPGTGYGYGRLPGPQVVQAVASYLGISQDDLLSQLRSGKSLAAIAAARGKPVAGLKNAILTAGTSEIDASTWLTAAQKATLVSDLKSHLDDIVNGTFPAGPLWPGAGGPGMGWPGRGGGPGGGPGM